jgi:hypothetical protein
MMAMTTSNSMSVNALPTPLLIARPVPVLVWSIGIDLFLAAKKMQPVLSFKAYSYYKPFFNNGQRRSRKLSPTAGNAVITPGKAPMA